VGLQLEVGEEGEGRELQGEEGEEGVRKLYDVPGLVEPQEVPVPLPLHPLLPAAPEVSERVRLRLTRAVEPCPDEQVGGHD
jgi:hypothetical protein